MAAMTLVHTGLCAHLMTLCMISVSVVFL